MLRIVQSASVATAKSYFTDGLSRGDYYSAAEELPGIWLGRASTMLGLSGQVGKDDFHALCDNRRPDTGEKLNPRADRDRKVGYDLTFSAPKSVSILHGVIGDKRILEVFRGAVRETMTLIEADSHVRVRKAGAVDERKTGNLVWAEFIHLTSRPIDGLCDPQLHAHCYTFNTSFDATEGRFKAGEFFHIKHDAPYFEAVFHSKLAEGLRRLGYQIENRPFGFEIRGIGQDNIERFSRRAQQIEALAEELGIADNDRAKDGLAARTRVRKSESMSQAEMVGEWRRRLERSQLSYHVAEECGEGRLTAREAVRLAISGSFERRSVVQHRRIIATALQNSLGNCSVAEIESAMDDRRDVVVHTRRGIRYATTREVIREEVEILRFLENTQATASPLNKDYQDENSKLDRDQKAAVSALLSCRDRVFVIEGRAGTGKTTLMKEAVSAIEAGGHKVFTFAPTSEAAHNVLKAEGFADSETIQQLLVNPALQRSTFKSVIWVDEAGLLSSRDLLRLVEIVRNQQARLVLSGDTRQHSSVERGDGLRLVVESDLVEVKATEQVHRQQPARYRRAVEELSRGSVMNGFQILESLGAIREWADPEDRLAAIVTDYVTSRQQFSNVLVVSPTHREGRLITGKIRDRLKESGEIAGDEQKIEILRSRNLTEAERQLPHFLREGDVIRFHKNAGSFKRGVIYDVVPGDNGRWQLRDGTGACYAIPARDVDTWQVYRRDRIPVAAGDRVRLTENTKSLEGERLHNGSLHMVTGFTPARELILDERHVLPPGPAMIDHGYVTTSYASQGKTCGKIIISQSAMSYPATSLEQFYVSVSRGKSAISIHTDDKAELLDAVKRSGKRMLATELVATDRLSCEVQRQRHSAPVWNRLIHAVCSRLEATVENVRRQFRQLGHSTTR